MSSKNALTGPGLSSFLKVISTKSAEQSTELFISLIKRRQIRGSKACAIATAHLLRRVISLTKGHEPGRLLYTVQELGKRVVNAVPRELAVGNIIRRVLGMIRDEEEELRGDDLSRSMSDAGSEPVTPRAEIPMSSLNAALSSSSIAPRRDQDISRPPLVSTTTTGTPRPMTSMFSILSHPTMLSGSASPAIGSGTSTPGQAQSTDFRAEVLEGIAEIIDELEQSDEQIASYAMEHVHPAETIFIYGSSQTVHRFLLKAASKRKFTVIHAESYPNNHSKAHSLVTGNSTTPNTDDQDLDMPLESFSKPLIAAGITVILIPDSAIFAMISRATKVVLSAHAVLSNGSIIAPSGSKSVIKAAKFHRVPVTVLAATFKLSPLYPHDPYDFIEYDDPGKVVEYQDSELVEGLTSVRNPLWDFVGGDEGAVDLFVTNVGAVSLGYLYRVVRDQYRDEDVDL